MDKQEAVRAARTELARAVTAVRQAWNLVGHAFGVKGSPQSSLCELVIGTLAQLDESLEGWLRAHGDGAEPHALSCLCAECHQARVSP
jgi:hypothetical protein